MPDSTDPEYRQPQTYLSAVSQDLPRTVIRGESFPDHISEIEISPGCGTVIPVPRLSSPGNAAITDWLNCTFLMEESSDSILTFLNLFRKRAGNAFFSLDEIGSGKYGWKRSFRFGKTGGLFAIGGQRGRALLSLSGEACNYIPEGLWPDVRDFLELKLDARITRWDGAVDDYEGLRSVDWAVAQYRAGEFRTGGRQPSTQQHGDWIGDGTKGRTFEVGSRKNGKMLRVYEKGKQLGRPSDPWVRWEVELHNKDRIIPWDVVTQPGRYVAGAYSCMDWVHDKMDRIKTIRRCAEITEESLAKSAYNSYGSYLNYLCEQGNSPEDIVKRIRRPGVPSRLKFTRALRDPT
jgi:phage replication initiation protein